MKRFVLVLLGACLFISCAATASGAAPASSATKTPIKHFVTLLQENHSFDNYFGTYPGANGIPVGVCMPKDVRVTASGCVKPFPIGTRGSENLPDSRTFGRAPLLRPTSSLSD